MDLVANSHTSAESQRTNFLSSTGNSTNHSVNTKKFAMTHKARAITLAKEVSRAAQLEHKNCKMALQLQAFEQLFATGMVPPLEPCDPIPTHQVKSVFAPAPRARFNDAVDNNVAVEMVDNNKNDEIKDDKNTKIILPPPSKNPP